MKLCRFGNPGAETPGILDNEGRIRDLSSACSDIDSSVLSPAGLKKLAAVDISRLPIVKNDVRLGVPFRGISKFIGIGLNYSDHAAEAGMPTPTEPIIFLKANSSISGPDDDVIQPRGSLKLDWEVELAVVIGSPARYVMAAVGYELPDAKDHRAGIAALPPHAVDVEPQVEILWVFNLVLGHQYVDMLNAGIVDPAKVVRVALQDAASVAGLMITTEAMVAETPKKKEAPAMPGGGMGGYGLLISSDPTRDRHPDPCARRHHRDRDPARGRDERQA